MGEDCGSWFPQQQFNCQSPNLNSSSAAPYHLGQQNTMNPGANLIPTNGTLPVYANTELPHSRAVQADEPCGWFYCLPRFRQAFTPSASNSVLKEQFLASPCDNRKETFKPNAMSGCAQKRFLVFDQSGNQTTLIFSSGIGAPVQRETPWGPKPPGACNFNRESPGTKRDLILRSGAMTDEFDENNGSDVQSEMREDTEELNALLYSDDDSDYTEDDDEVTSTGHSPSTMTVHNQQDWFDGRAEEEVASSVGPTKKRKRCDGGYDDDLPSLIDTASTLKLNRPIECEHDAESSCANGNKPGSSEMDSLSGNKRMRKEKIRETVSVLQSFLPVGKGKDVIVVLDEAISYLKTLKHKAEALGL